MWKTSWCGTRVCNARVPYWETTQSSKSRDPWKQWNQQANLETHETMKSTNLNKTHNETTQINFNLQLQRPTTKSRINPDWMLRRDVLRDLMVQQLEAMLKHHTYSRIILPDFHRQILTGKPSIESGEYLQKNRGKTENEKKEQRKKEEGKSRNSSSTWCIWSTSLRPTHGTRVSNTWVAIVNSSLFNSKC